MLHVEQRAAVHALDRFFVDQPAATLPEPETIEDFFVPGDATLGALAEIYGVTVAPEKASMTLSDYFTEQFMRPPREHDALRLGPMALVAHTVAGGKATTVGLQLAEPEHEPRTPSEKATAYARRIWAWMRERFRP